MIPQAATAVVGYLATVGNSILYGAGQIGSTSLDLVQAVGNGVGQVFLRLFGA